MNLFKKITTGALALSLVAGLTGSAFAQTAEDYLTDTGDVTVEIVSNGILVVVIHNFDLGEVNYEVVDTTYTAERFTIETQDMRGTAQGFTVTISGTDFEQVDPATGTVVDSFDIENLRLFGKESVPGWTMNHPTNVAPVLSDVDPVTNDAQTALHADPGTGAGHFWNMYDVELTIPAGTLVSEYSSTLTVSANAAP